ncbi:transmembrane and death domain protein 1-like isoform X3 [Acanthopagrus latus]|uniref:transmembrane and death domain protein 1-like isoform X3 n=1 Tax=Acanthopagrus latus TaxID=8177 RepID=UPI00187BF581|nr:transmembrane and death domain protein 1-like isoform X3 [Acanthopagrus latus]
MIFCPVFVFLLLSSALGEDTVAEDIGAHQLERLVELLTSKECRDLLFALSHPEDNIFQHLQRLSPERNRLDLKPRARRDTSPAADGEAQCRAALTDWLLRYGEQTYYDRLSRALQHIGRTDIAIGETRTETPRTHEPCEMLLTAANVTSRHLSMSLDKRKTGTKPHSGTRRSGEEHQPGQNTEPEALRSRLSRTRQVFKLPTGLQEPAA